MAWGRRGWTGPWPGRGPFSYLPPWQRPGWLFGRGSCWWLFGGPRIYGVAPWMYGGFPPWMMTYGMPWAFRYPAFYPPYW